MKIFSTSSSRFTGLMLVMGLALTAGHSQAEPLSAMATEQARQRGAALWDMRGTGTAALPQSARVDSPSVSRWLDHGDLPALARAVSASGIDLSREVVIYGDAGDARAQALYESLLPVATGKLHWFVGGMAEWQMAGLPMAPFHDASVPVRLSVPQQLNLRAPVAPVRGELAPADASRRASYTLSPPAANVAAQPTPATFASLAAPYSTR